MKGQINMEYVYHIFPSSHLAYIKRYGLCSPLKMYETNRDLFMQTTGKIYEDRTKAFLKKSKLTPEDIMNYLENSPQREGFSTKTIFFSFIPICDYHSEFQKNFKDFSELKVSVSYLKKYTPTIVGPGKESKPSTWKEIRKPEFLETVQNQAGLKVHPVYRFKYVIHLAIEAYHIPIGKFSIMESVLSSNDSYIFFLSESKNDDIMMFPSDYRDVLTGGVKIITYRIKDEFGKYQKGKIYRVFSYEGEDWHCKIRIIEVTQGRYKDFKELRQKPSSTDKKYLKYVSPMEPMERVRFTLAK